MVDIFKKIEDIRKKPEHIRRRYVWGMVFVCATFIFLIWIFSIKSSFYMNKENQEESVAKEEFLESLKEGKDAFNEIKDGIEDIKSIEGQTESNSSEIANPDLENSTLKTPATENQDASSLNQ